MTSRREEQGTAASTTCPHCQEEIKDGATRCPHCTAVLREGALQPGKDKIVYIVDRDLLRFGKFAGAILVAFVLIGVFFFGFDLKRTTETVSQAAADAQRSHMAMQELRGKMTEIEKQLDDKREAMNAVDVQLDQTRKGMDASRKKMDAAHKELEQTMTDVRAIALQARSDAREAKDMLTRIKRFYTEVEELVKAARALNPEEEEAYAELRRRGSSKIREKQDPELYGRDLWENGTTIRIAFMGGTTKEHKLVKRAAEERLKYANLKFEWDAPDADVRISFENDGAWTYVGTQCLAIPKHAATSNYGWVDEAVVLHEFGHVLGLIHEHQVPAAATLQWKKETVLADMAGPPNNWGEATVNRTMFAVADSPTEKPFDNDSIMLYQFPEAWTGGKFAQKQKLTLSKGDKEWIAKLYPRE